MHIRNTQTFLCSANGHHHICRLRRHETLARNTCRVPEADESYATSHERTNSEKTDAVLSIISVMLQRKAHRPHTITYVCVEAQRKHRGIQVATGAAVMTAAET
jgi:hypothetical protein